MIIQHGTTLTADLDDGRTVKLVVVNPPEETITHIVHTRVIEEKTGQLKEAMDFYLPVLKAKLEADESGSSKIRS